MSHLTPSVRHRPPRIDTTSNLDEDQHRLSSESFVASPSSPRIPSLPSFRVSISPNTEKPPPSPSWGHTSHKTNNRARDESRKLLALLLGQLQRRALPPPIFDAFATFADGPGDNSFGVLVENMKDAVRLRRGRRDTNAQLQAAAFEDDSDDDKEREFSTDATFDLMMQLKEVLSISGAQGWQVFDDSTLLPERGTHRESTTKSSSPFRRSRNSLQPGGRRSRSPSPASGVVRAPELLSLCISILSSVITEDCRFKTASPRPSRPPNALQALTLDVAQFLLFTHRHNPKVISQIGFALIPAFSTFPPEMHGRLLKFFEEGVIHGILEDLGRVRGLDGVASLSAVDSEAHTAYPGVNTSPLVSIQVDEVPEDPRTDPRDLQWSPWSTSSNHQSIKVLSTNAPLQPLSLYYLASLISPLLAEILECIDFLHPDVEVFHRVYRLLDLIVNTKLDAYLDILQIVAYHTSKARYAAVSILSTFWPKAVGHVVVSKPFTFSSYVNSLSNSHIPEDHPFAHQFLPWRFPSQSTRLGFGGISQHDCRVCTRPIRGFGLLCHLCMCAVHFDCYDDPDGSHLLQYSMMSDLNVQRVAMYRFSPILLDHWGMELRTIRRHQHFFRLVNLFTLCLCFVCREPLWGCTAQGLKCTSCLQFVHSSCLSDASVSNLPPCGTTKVNSDLVNIDWVKLRSSCLDFYRDIPLTNEELALRSYEEITIFHAILWTQSQIIMSGVALGSIVVMQKGKNNTHATEHRLDEFDLHRAIRFCETLLASDRLCSSLAMDEYLHENHLSRPDHSFMFDWSNLAYIATAIKAPYSVQNTYNPSSNLLNVAQHDVLMDQSPDTANHPFEVVSLSHMRDVLGYELQIHSDPAARFLLSHLHHLGFFNLLDRNPSLFGGATYNKHAHCVFPLPLGLDLSTDVEILVCAVEACLSDLDLSVNEVGFLLLVRKLWPNGLASEYASRRLARNVISWILAEDENLAIILRDYLAKQKTLPGVQSGLDVFPWPSAPRSRPTPTSSVNNGGDYVAARRTLLGRYASQWLLALHDQDNALYAVLVYDICSEITEDGTLQGNIFAAKSFDDQKKYYAAQHDKILRCILRLLQASTTFSVFDDLLTRWLESVSRSTLFEEPMPSLHRLFSREVEATHRASTILDLISTEGAGVAVDPWRVVFNIGAQSEEGVTRSLQWLCALARSGVDIPITSFMRFSSLVTSFDSPLSDSLLLVKAAMSSAWLNSIGRQELQLLFSALHSRLSLRITNSFRNGNDVTDITCFIRQSLATCLLLYGCDRTRIMALNLITEDEIKDLPSRRRMHPRASMVSDPIVVDPGLTRAIELYLTISSDDISCVIAKFLHMFLTESPLLEPYEVDNFILRNGRLLSVCAWQFYDIQRPDLSSIRTSFLLRTLVVDSQPLQTLLHDTFLPSTDWELRLVAVTRLFRIILDVTSPAFNVEGGQWRSSVIDVFYSYFTAMWADGREEIRLAVDTFSSTLLPAHFDAISLCWNEALAKAPVEDRVRLVSFLIQLRPHFPHWKVLSWDVIVETLLEDDYGQNNTDSESGPMSAHLSTYGLPSRDGAENRSTKAKDPDMAALRVSILLLSLQMIADGITVDSLTLLKLKAHLVRVFGFKDVSVVPSPDGHAFHVRFGEAPEIPELALPCVKGLMSVLDAHYSVDLTPSTMGVGHGQDEKQSSLLVGSVFVDVSLAMFCTVRDLSALPVLIVKNMLEALCIIIYKHDLASHTLMHLQQNLRRAVVRALELLVQDVGYELRQLALSAVQAFIKRWHSFMGSIIYMAIESAAKLVALQSHHAQDVLVGQAKTFIEATLVTYSTNGLFVNLLKRHLDREFFIVLKQITDANAKGSPSESLRDALLRDTLSRAIEHDQATFQNVLNNLMTYVEVVHHQGYSVDLMIFVGQHLTHLARRTSEWASDGLDPGPLLVIPATLIQHNKAHSREMLSYTDTVLRVALNRLNVNTNSLSRLLQVSTTLYRKTTLSDTSPPINGIVLVVFEILSDGLRMKARALPSTLKSMLEAILTEVPGSLSLAVTHLNSFLGLVDSGLHFLENHVWADVQSENDFTASLVVAKMILQAAEHDPSIINKLSDQTTERSSRLVLGVRGWNILVLAALMGPTTDWITILLPQLPSFSTAHNVALRGYLQSGSGLPEHIMTDINHAYIAIKLWLMLAHKNSMEDADGFAAVAVWNELWPPFESFVVVLEAEAQAGSSMTLMTLASSSVADLFLFLRTLRTPPALHTSTHIATLNRFRTSGHSDSSTGKLSRALRSMSESPPEVSLDILINQAAKEIVAAEKLRVLESKREKIPQEKRGIPERQR